MDILLSFVTVSLDDPRNEVFVLKRSDDCRAGMLWMCSSKDQYTCDDTGYIMGIFVEPELRGNGLGKALLKAAEEWCSEKGLVSMTLNVSPLNDALGLYEKCGFRERSIVMRKDLPGSRGSSL
jgi:Acetyltransferases